MPVAGGLRVRVALAADDDLGAASPDQRDLRGARDLGHEDPRRDPEFPGREGDRRARGCRPTRP
jgi:hypothetical protein